MAKKAFSFRLSESSQEFLKMGLDNNLGDDMTEVIEYALINYMWEEIPDVMRAHLEEKARKTLERNSNFNIYDREV